MNSIPKIRDLFAAPFYLLGLVFEYLGVRIGGKWTAEMVLNAKQRYCKKGAHPTNNEPL